MAGKEKKSPSKSSPSSALDAFFRDLESRTSNAIHLRLLKAAQKSDPSAALERELGRIMEELLRET
jgi:hypothetical protein